MVLDRKITIEFPHISWDAEADNAVIGQSVVGHKKYTTEELELINNIDLDSESMTLSRMALADESALDADTGDNMPVSSFSFTLVGEGVIYIHPGDLINVYADDTMVYNSGGITNTFRSPYMIFRGYIEELLSNYYIPTVQCVAYDCNYFLKQIQFDSKEYYKYILSTYPSNVSYYKDYGDSDTQDNVRYWIQFKTANSNDYIFRFIKKISGYFEFDYYPCLGSSDLLPVLIMANISLMLPSSLSLSEALRKAYRLYPSSSSEAPHPVLLLHPNYTKKISVYTIHKGTHGARLKMCTDSASGNTWFEYDYSTNRNTGIVGLTLNYVYGFYTIAESSNQTTILQMFSSNVDTDLFTYPATNQTRPDLNITDYITGTIPLGVGFFDAFPLGTWLVIPQRNATDEIRNGLFQVSSMLYSGTNLLNCDIVNNIQNTGLYDYD